jgi:hypothetical protein
VVTVEDTMISGLPMPDAVSVLVSTELLAQLEADWSPPVQIHIDRTPGIGSGYEMVARPPQRIEDAGTAATVATCDAGHCDQPRAALVPTADLGWLPVCRAHAMTELAKGRES